jgi:Surface adhesin CshA non-repetitive domain 2
VSSFQIRLAGVIAMLVRLLACLLLGLAAPAFAATCSQAGSQGTAPATWQTYCWLDFTSYSDATARTASGQNFSFTLSDGATLTFNVKTTGSTTTSIAAPSWTGAAVGNSAFLSIPGKPILYQTVGGITTPSTITISNILITPPAGTSAVTAYAFVAADAESTDNNEALSFTTNGTGWTVLDQVNPITGTNYPTTTGVGTATFTANGGGVTGNTGAWIVGTDSPTNVSATLTGSGLQGAMFAVRFASLRLNKQIVGARVDPADQFKFDIAATSTGAQLATGTSSGTGLGPFTAAAVSLASGIPLTLTESMAPGSVTPLSEYQSRLTCTNGVSGSSTPVPTNLLATAYSFGTLQFGDAIQCTFTNTPYPHLRLTKALGAGGRQADTDQFTVNVKLGATTLATTTTTGIGSALGSATTPALMVNSGTTYAFAEVAAGTTNLLQYDATMACLNASSTSSTVLPTLAGGSVTPQLGDVISCTITNTKITPGTMTLVKSSSIVSDPVSGTSNPKALPGAIVTYSLLASYSGTTRTSSNTVFLIDRVPSQIAVGTSSAFTFIQGTPSSTLTYNAATDLRFSNQATAPADFAACSAAPHNYSPSAAYDPNVTFICLNPKGRMPASTGTPSSFAITFRAEVK